MKGLRLTVPENFAAMPPPAESLAVALDPVNSELQELSRLLPLMIPTRTAIGQTMVQAIFSSPGKQVRPAFFFLSANLVGYSGDQLMPMAAVAEFVHTASLLHDDVVDSSTLRRNKPTANSVWGDQAAVLVGDLIYSTASEMMARTAELDIVTTFSRAIQSMSEAELLQLEHVFDFAIPTETYFQIIRGKTGALLSASCAVAAILGQTTAKQHDALRDFGMAIGVAFQLLDDALDYMGDTEIFGKRSFCDLAEGRITLPLILLRDKMTPSERLQLETILKTGPQNADDTAIVADLVIKYDTAQEAIREAQAYTTQAIAGLQTHFPPTMARWQLEAMATSLLSRLS